MRPQNEKHHNLPSNCDAVDKIATPRTDPVEKLPGMDEVGGNWSGRRDATQPHSDRCEADND